MFKNIKSRIILIIFLFGIITTSIPITTYVLAQDNNAISSKEAEKAASFYTKKYSSQYANWANATTCKDPVVYYSADNLPTCYEFTVLQKDGTVAGFLIVSAKREWMPLLESSTGKPPSSYVSVARDIAINKGFNSTGETPRMVYWGGLTYSVQFGEEMIGKNLAIHLPTGVIQEVPTTFKLQMDKGKAKVEWDALDGWNIMISMVNISVKMLSTRSTTVQISGVPPYYQTSYNNGHGDNGYDSNASLPSCAGTGNDPWYPWDGCSCIAGAMVLGYWNTHGYSSLPSGEDELIDWEHFFMLTTDSGVTMPWYIDDGISDFFSSWGYGDDFSVNNDSGTNWDDITEQVDANQPAVLSLLGGSLSGHSVTIVGYQEVGGIKTVTIHNDWDTSDHNLTYNDWNIAQITKVEEN